MDKPACHLCRFWSWISDEGVPVDQPMPVEYAGECGDGGEGECRRHAPVPQITERGPHINELMVYFPNTHDYQWCGEFEQRPIESEAP